MEKYKCCHKPNIQVFDLWIAYKPGVWECTINRVCLTCGTHWHGDPRAPIRYTKREWDRMLEEHS